MAAADPDKNWFFDRQVVIDRVGRATARVLSRMGSFTRTRARSLLRYGKKPSPAGSPPTVHRAGGFTRVAKKKDGTQVRRPASPLRELVQFAFDPGRGSVVVGPARFRAASQAVRPAAGTVPGLIEGGGRATRRDPAGRTITLAGRRGGSFEVVARGASKVLTYKPRPFMGKALELERPNFPKLFRGEVSR